MFVAWNCDYYKSSSIIICWCQFPCSFLQSLVKLGKLLTSVLRERETVWQPINPAILIHEATNFNSLSSKSRRTNIKTAAELSLLLYSMCAQSKSGNLSKPLDNLKLTRGFKSLIISGSFVYRLQWMKSSQNVSLKPNFVYN